MATKSCLPMMFVALILVVLAAHASARKLVQQNVKAEEATHEANVVHNNEANNVGGNGNKAGVKDKKCLVGGFAAIGGAAGVGGVIPVLGGAGGLGGLGGGAGGLGGLGGLGGAGGIAKGGGILP
ncbi:hypothetical protein Scep_010443 [Stephania cephalantha]|uniref:Uncharacterized protein n=1 Tax=Stephania cephalantha TaxID=152367 RepID=A0AAP0JXH9_9MAGN